MKYITSPTEYKRHPHDIVVFMGGSIEMGKAEDWQRVLRQRLEHLPDEVVLLNPRRDDWDSSWIQDPAAGTQFNQQVNWELDGIEVADIKIFYFADDTMSPITLLELGLYSDSNTIVKVGPGYYRYGNVKIVCERKNVYNTPSFEDMIEELVHRIEKYAVLT